MTQALAALAALAGFDSVTRLYAFQIGDGDGDGGLPGSDLLVEAFVADDAVQGLGVRDVIALSTSATLDPQTLLGQRATLEVSLAGGTRARFGGDICAAAQLGSDGGLARYRVRIAHWIWPSCRRKSFSNARVTCCGLVMKSTRQVMLKAVLAARL